MTTKNTKDGTIFFENGGWGAIYFEKWDYIGDLRKDYIYKHMNLRRNFYGGRVRSYKSFDKAMRCCEVFLVWLRFKPVGMVYLSPESKADERQFHFAVFDKFKVRNGAWRKIIGKILHFAFDKERGLGYTAIHGYNPYPALVRFSKSLGFVEDTEWNETTWDGWINEEVKEFHVIKRGE